MLRRHRLAVFGLFAIIQLRMDTEKSITLIDQLLGKKIHVIAFGTSYLGTLKKVDHEKGFIVVSDGVDTVNIELERVESYIEVEPQD